jgi:quinolinate synthase
VKSEKIKHPDALVLTHPECNADVLALSDFKGSTAEIIDFAKESDCKEFIICTEAGVNYKLITDNPQKRFYYPAPTPCCADMKLNTLENILSVLENEDNEVLVDEAVAASAWKPLDRMLELGR